MGEAILPYIKLIHSQYYGLTFTYREIDGWEHFLQHQPKVGSKPLKTMGWMSTDSSFMHNTNAFKNKLEACIARLTNNDINTFAYFSASLRY